MVDLPFAIGLVVTCKSRGVCYLYNKYTRTCNLASGGHGMAEE